MHKGKTSSENQVVCSLKKKRSLPELFPFARGAQSIPNKSNDVIQGGGKNLSRKGGEIHLPILRTLKGGGGGVFYSSEGRSYPSLSGRSASMRERRNLLARKESHFRKNFPF